MGARRTIGWGRRGRQRLPQGGLRMDAALALARLAAAARPATRATRAAAHAGRRETARAASRGASTSSARVRRRSRAVTTTPVEAATNPPSSACHPPASAASTADTDCGKCLVGGCVVWVCACACAGAGGCSPTRLRTLGTFAQNELSAPLHSQQRAGKKTYARLVRTPSDGAHRGYGQLAHTAPERGVQGTHDRAPAS